MTDCYVIVECDTGFMDGIYYGHGIAKEAYRAWRENRPNRTHMLCRMEEISGPNTDWVIPDCLFLGNRRDDVA
jgi:hypothetical protein